jgi:hypothetical protein
MKAYEALLEAARPYEDEAANFTFRDLNRAGDTGDQGRRGHIMARQD